MASNYAMIRKMIRHLFRGCVYPGLLSLTVSIVALPRVSLSAGDRNTTRAKADMAAISQESVDAHNRARQKVGVPPLGWDAALARLAQDWAQRICRNGKGLGPLAHRPQKPGSPGENLWQGATTEAKTYAISEAVERWVEEQKFYDKKTGTCHGGVCGHYTQVVWRDTTHVGCGMATCPTGGMRATVWVCNYRPAGNLIGARPY